MKNTLMAAAFLAGCNHPVDYKDEESLTPEAKGKVTALSADFMNACKSLLDLEKKNSPSTVAVRARLSDDLKSYRNAVFSLLESHGCDPDVKMTCNQLHYPKVDLRIRVEDQGGDWPNCEAE